MEDSQPQFEPRRSGAGASPQPQVTHRPLHSAVRRVEDVAQKLGPGTGVKADSFPG